jgi:hypothetical protein
MKGVYPSAESRAAGKGDVRQTDATASDQPETATRSSEIKQSLPLYLPACGVLCDVLWWARRRTD